VLVKIPKEIGTPTVRWTRVITKTLSHSREEKGEGGIFGGEGIARGKVLLKGRRSQKGIKFSDQMVWCQEDT